MLTSDGRLVLCVRACVVVFFVGTHYKQRRATAGPAPKIMSQSGGWRSPFAGEENSFYEERSSADAGDSLEHASSEHGHPARFVQAGATEPGLWYSGADASVPPASMLHDHSSQSRSGPQTGGSSSMSHGALQPPSDLAHTNPPSSRTCLPTPASSYERAGVVELFGRLRRKRGASASTAPSPPPRGAAAVLPAFALPDGLGVPEGLLRPGPTHSTRTLGDHVDYSRPIAYAMRPGFGMRANSGTTWASNTPWPTIHSTPRLIPRVHSRMLYNAIYFPCPRRPLAREDAWAYSVPARACPYVRKIRQRWT
ncbi:hypothetical protein GGX14DRAFT_560934 [Mycena pura]|uniref:Uncharacterized protein n=1 Tax=Mycena pura TaxID=153505 RepID=A0AAD6VPX9_9AGAR|nr:hypothetical protein GGX14DRAFT_560934 [Mycena pura]